MKESNPLAPFLEQEGLLILDGGLATELEARGYNLDDDLWSARLLTDDPQAIYQLHLDYLEAGADCIISASYQATIEGFIRKGLDSNQAESLILSSVQLAIDARNHFWSQLTEGTKRIKPVVAASVGPYGAALADGSEYTGSYDLDQEGLYSFHQRRWDLLSKSAADLLACETLPSYLELKALVRLIRETPGIFTWISFSCRDGEHISDGTPIISCIEEIRGLRQVAAVGINCTTPRYVPSLIAQIRSRTDLPVIVYPNSGEKYHADRGEWFGEANPEEFALNSEVWRSAGAEIIGGCCRTNPDHIRNIRQRLL